jgi:biopolymer transport protein ExbD
MRIEIMPLIDVIFLLLTFFIYAMVLMIRAELLPVEMPSFASGKPATPEPAITITLDGSGGLFVNREPVTMENVVSRLREHLQDDPDAAIYIAAEATGEVDRLPVFYELWDRLAPEGFNIKLVGRPSDDAAGGDASGADG